jgi:hypothetical protein
LASLAAGATSLAAEVVLKAQARHTKAVEILDEVLLLLVVTLFVFITRA